MIITVDMQDDQGLTFVIDPMASPRVAGQVEYPFSAWSPGARRMVAAALRIAADQVDTVLIGESDG